MDTTSVGFIAFSGWRSFKKNNLVAVKDFINQAKTYPKYHVEEEKHCLKTKVLRSMIRS